LPGFITLLGSSHAEGLQRGEALRADLATVEARWSRPTPWWWPIVLPWPTIASSAARLIDCH
jgi:hypothetical protein